MAGDGGDELPSVDHTPLNEGGVGKIQFKQFLIGCVTAQLNLSFTLILSNVMCQQSIEYCHSLTEPNMSWCDQAIGCLLLVCNLPDYCHTFD